VRHRNLKNNQKNIESKLKMHLRKITMRQQNFTLHLLHKKELKVYPLVYIAMTYKRTAIKM
jgi:hypothetical protein